MTIDGWPSTESKGPSFKVTDRPVDGLDADAADARREAVTAIERIFVGGADWPSVVASLRLMRLIIEKPPTVCRGCRTPFRVQHGAAFALYRRGLKLPKHCAGCRAKRRQERSRRPSPDAGPVGISGTRMPDETPLRPGNDVAAGVPDGARGPTIPNHQKQVEKRRTV